MDQHLVGVRRPRPAASATTIVSGYTVSFPGGKVPFPSQRAVMSKAIQALRTGGGAVACLESPTGSGKTLALLTATLAWQRGTHAEAMRDWAEKGRAGEKRALKPPRPPRVFFASRTHSQLAQIVEALRACAAVAEADGNSRPVRSAVLSSRQHGCTHRSVSKKPPGQVDEACKDLVKNGACANQHKAAALKAKAPNVWDVEELHALGKSSNACAYYGAQEALIDADVVLCPCVGRGGASPAACDAGPLLLLSRAHLARPTGTITSWTRACGRPRASL